MIEIEIDGKKFQVEPGRMIIEVADEADIRIPRFCYHKKLSVAANCRMCLVDVEKSGKPLPACATPVTDGMIVRTQSPKALDAQKSVMEFLLLNHPLDCPICDQGGQCELQDIAMGYGKDISRYHEGKRSVKDKSLGSLVATEMTRCIHCTRCVRFTEEIAGFQEMGTMGRGESTEVGTYVQKSLTSELSGNIIDLCPVGALTSKPFQFHARAWEMLQHASIAPHDCIGSNIAVHSLRQKVMRVVPKDNEAVNETWLSDRDRFSYEAINSDERLHFPLIKENGEWQQTDWPTAFKVVADNLQRIIATKGAKQVGALMSPSATVEEAFLLQKIMRELGSNNIDHRLQQTDFSMQHATGAYPGLHISLDALENQNTIVLIGSHIQREQPIAAHRVRKATLQGGAVHVINPVDYPFHFDVTTKQVVKPSAIPHVLAEIIKALVDAGVESPIDGLLPLVKDVQASETAKAIAKQLQQDNQKLILLGAIAQNHPAAGDIKSLAEIIARMTHAHVGLLTTGANSAGAWLSGAIPHRGVGMKNIGEAGLNTVDMLQAKLAAYILLNVEPELDCADPVAAKAAMQQAEFVVAITPYFDSQVAEYANVLLPAATFAETSGTYINAEGRWQRFNGAVVAQGESRPSWKILRVLGNVLHLEHFDYQSSDEVYEEVKAATEEALSHHYKHLHLPAALAPVTQAVERVSEWPIYRADLVVRRAPALQENIVNDDEAVYMPISLANRLQISADSMVKVSVEQTQIVLPVRLVDNMPDNTVYIPHGCASTSALRGAFGVVTLERGDKQ